MTATDVLGNELDHIRLSSGGWDDDLFLCVHNSDGDANPLNDLFLMTIDPTDGDIFLGIGNGQGL